MLRFRRSTQLVSALAAAGALFAIAACGGEDNAAKGADEPAAATLTEPAPAATPPPALVPPSPEAPPEPPPAPPEPAEEPEEPAQPDAEEVTTPDGVTCTSREPNPPADPPTFDAPPGLALVDGATYTATIETSCGDIVLELDPVNAPLTTNNFVELARAGFYDGLTFHRAVPGFVIQGGDPTGDGTGGPGYSFEDELPSGYETGDIAMANAGPDTNGSQFFILTGDGTYLLPRFSKFGRVTEGREVALAIEYLGDPDTERPEPTVYIYSVTITES